MDEEFKELTEDVNRKEFERQKQVFQDYIASDEYREKIILRLKINDACYRSSEAKTSTWNLCARPDNFAEGCAFFIENFGFTFAPKPYHAPHHLPFILFDFQKDTIKWLIDHIENGRDGLIEKSREMGMSWVVFVWVMIWYWIFRDGTNFLLGSYKEALVDNRTKDSLFGMIDYGIDSLPKWILPAGFQKEKHRTQMKLINPVTGNMITGDTMNPEFGRGARKTAILFDELGFWDYAKDAWEACADTTACRIANSTPKGYNFYAMLRESGIDVLTLHWKLHPLKDQAWYEYECSRRTAEQVAQELDISYNKSQEGRVYAEWDNDNVEIGEFKYDDTLPLYVGWDFGKSDDTAIIWCQKDERGKLRILDTYKNSGKTIDFYVPFVTGILPSDSYKYSKEDLDCVAYHKGWKKGTHFGDPAGRFQNQVTNTTVLSVLKENGINVNFKDEWKEFQKRKTAGKLLIRDGIKLHNNKRNKYFEMCIVQATYPKVKNNGVEEIRSQAPKHDWTSHFRSSFEYLALGLSELKTTHNRPYDKFKPKQNVQRKRLVGY